MLFIDTKVVSRAMISHTIKSIHPNPKTQVIENAHIYKNLKNI